MSQKTNNKNIQVSPKNTLGLSLMPSVFAAGCCATTPLFFIFGITSLQFTFAKYAWWFFAAGLLILIISVVFFFYQKGIKTKQDILDNKVVITITILQTLALTSALYYFFVKVAVPVIWTGVLNQTASCCNL